MKVAKQMSRELVDITLFLDGIEDMDWDTLEEFLNEHNIKYQVTKTENQRTESDDPEFDKPDPYDVWKDNQLCD